MLHPFKKRFQLIIKFFNQRKIFDFLSGATYALNGNVQKIANNIFVFVPENVDVTSSVDQKTSVNFGEPKSPWR